MVLFLALQSPRIVPQETTGGKFVTTTMQLVTDSGKVATLYRTHDNRGSSTLVEPRCFEGAKADPHEWWYGACRQLWRRLPDFGLWLLSWDACAHRQQLDTTQFAPLSQVRGDPRARGRLAEDLLDAKACIRIPYTTAGRAQNPKRAPTRLPVGPSRTERDRELRSIGPNALG